MNKKPKRLLHVTSSLKMGGAETVLCNLIKHLDKHEFEHHVIYFHSGPHVKHLAAMGIKTYHVTGFIFLYDPVFFMRLFTLINSTRPDVIHSLLWFANVSMRFIARMLRIPLVSVLHNNVDQDGWVRNAVDKITARLAKTTVAVSQEVANSVVHKKKWLPAQKVTVIKNGIDLKRIHKKAYLNSKTKSSLGLSESHYVFGSVGRFEPVKRYPLLLEAFALVKEREALARLVLVGIGSQEKFLRRKAKMLGIEHDVVFIIGQQAYPYYPLFDCFVQSSDKEGISIALLEAMSFAKPCAVTNSDMHHSVLEHNKTGVVVSASNKRMLSQALLTVMHEHVWAKNLGLQAQKAIVDNFSVNAMVGAYRDIFLQQ